VIAIDAFGKGPRNERGQLHGHGEYTCPFDGYSYVGQFADGLRHGQGEMITQWAIVGSNRRHIYGSYVGHFQTVQKRYSAIRTFEGEAHYPHNKRKWRQEVHYKGQMQTKGVNPEPHGRSVMTYKNGDRLEGTWRDFGDGYGVVGSGAYYYQNGARLEGLWPETEHIVMFEANGTRCYVGGLARTRQRMHGRRLDCATYQMSGRGVYCYDDDSKYHGGWWRGGRSGPGTLYHADGRVEQQIYKQDVLLTGRCVCECLHIFSRRSTHVCGFFVARWCRRWPPRTLRYRWSA
jgi:hypothetical protein